MIEIEEYLDPEKEYGRNGFEDTYNWLDELKKNFERKEKLDKVKTVCENTENALESNYDKLYDILEPHKLSTRLGVSGFVVGGSLSGLAGYNLGETAGDTLLEYGGEESELIYSLALGSSSLVFIGLSLYGGYRLGKVLTKVEERFISNDKVDHINLKEAYKEFKEEFD